MTKLDMAKLMAAVVLAGSAATSMAQTAGADTSGSVGAADSTYQAGTGANMDSSTGVHDSGMHGATMDDSTLNDSAVSDTGTLDGAVSGTGSVSETQPAGAEEPLDTTDGWSDSTDQSTAGTMDAGSVDDSQMGDVYSTEEPATSSTGAATGTFDSEIESTESYDEGTAASGSIYEQDMSDSDLSDTEYESSSDGLSAR